MSSLDLSLVTGHETIGSDAAASGGVVVTASASSNTKGAWVQLSAASAAEASWIDVIFGSTSTVGRFLIDIGIGASGAETVLLSNLHFDNGVAQINSAGHYRFPVAIPAGSRVAARMQCTSASATMRVLAILGHGDPGGLTAPGSVQTYGANTADSGLTAVNAGSGTANLDTAWVQLTASTTAAARWLVVGLGHDTTTAAGNRVLLDIGIGAAGAEVEILSDLFVIIGGGEETTNPRTLAFPVDIPAGTRIAVRLRAAGVPESIDVAVYLADAAAPAGGGGGASAHAFASWSG